MTKTQKLNATLVALATFAAVTFTVPAYAAGQNCGPRETLIERLSTRFGETRRGIGLGTKNQVMEVFASEKTGSWTIAVTLPDGRMCLIASGQAWEDRMDDLSHLADADA